MTLVELRFVASSLGIPGRSKARRKADLQRLISDWTEARSAHQACRFTMELAARIPRKKCPRSRSRRVRPDAAERASLEAWIERNARDPARTTRR